MMQLKISFTFRVADARKIRQLAEYAAKQSGARVDTQAFLEALIGHAHQEMEEEQKAARRIRACKKCGNTFSGNPACPNCGEWSA